MSWGVSLIGLLKTIAAAFVLANAAAWSGSGNDLGAESSHVQRENPGDLNTSLTAEGRSAHSCLRKPGCGYPYPYPYPYPSLYYGYGFAGYGFQPSKDAAVAADITNAAAQRAIAEQYAKALEVQRKAAEQYAEAVAAQRKAAEQFAAQQAAAYQNAIAAQREHVDRMAAQTRQPLAYEGPHLERPPPPALEIPPGPGLPPLRAFERPEVPTRAPFEAPMGPLAPLPIGIEN